MLSIANKLRDPSASVGMTSNLMLRKIFKTGNSVAVTLPQKILQALGLKLGSQVNIEAEESKQAIKITPAKKGTQLPLGFPNRYRLGSQVTKKS